jgi:transcription antitermination factor NusG
MEKALWYGLRVRQSFERIVALHLKKRAVESFVPFYLVPGRPGRGPRTEAPLFPGFVFCKCEVAALGTIWVIPGVIAVVHGVEPTDTIPVQEIENLQRVVNSGLPYKPWPFTPGRLVTVAEGPLRGVTGVLHRATPTRQLVLSLTLIRRSIVTEIATSWKLAYRART